MWTYASQLEESVICSKGVMIFQHSHAKVYISIEVLNHSKLITQVISFRLEDTVRTSVHCTKEGASWDASYCEAYSTDDSDTFSVKIERTLPGENAQRQHETAVPALSTMDCGHIFL